MSSSIAGSASSRSRPQPPPLEVVNWPLRDEPASAGMAVGAAVIAAASTGWALHSAAAALLSLLALGLSLWRLLIPVTFALDARGLTQIVWRRRRRVAWTELRRFQVRPRGVLLLPGEEASYSEQLRGLYIRFAGRQEALLQCLNYYLGPPLGQEASSPAPPSPPRQHLRNEIKRPITRRFIIRQRHFRKRRNP